MKLVEKIRAAEDFIRTKYESKIDLGLILGSGLGHLADEIKDPVIIQSHEIPYFPRSTVEGHEGLFILGDLEGKKVATMKGRIHYYEGYSMKDITFPVRVFNALGAKALIVTNACGGINLDFEPGDIMIIRDHINFMGNNPLLGEHDPEMGVRFLDLTDAYDRELSDMALSAGADLGIPLREGVYLAVSGPCYETMAEIEFIRRIGADAVGMSTVPETIVARQGGMKVLGISCITDVIREGGSISHEEVLAVAEKTRPRFQALVRECIRRINL
ncbi:MAG: purine-nucleoside phosphorylase [Candidatus Eremiobacteraeota bacterium]|nr:purine-nucleoside phosphorylase [Candidatus Eremiobacteraeota bacterium]